MSDEPDDDFEGFSDTVGQITVTPEERYLIRRAVFTACPAALMAWSPLIRMAYMSIAEKQLLTMKEIDPTFIATTISIDVTNKKVHIT